MHELFGETISTYSRAQAVEDGELVDVSETAKEAGIRINTCVTRSVWNDISTDLGPGEDITGRLWDVLFMAAQAARSGGSSAQVKFKVKLGRKVHTYRFIVGPGDTPAPVSTILQVDED